ncbi:CHASE2 domain-containing protein [Ahrensia sp. R2A130]|uniref:CHASE2 domain-containing protein n=1 Tax=Ahrensia sp. R2A130 TaxID=744979 RepID=UPI0001E0C398|nr:adenylate/guanylate cyclase domain-containing protein [Ahrensia sp. R2A130]EFL87843.1 adenylate/guanylate cyclase [Ahrensia sp. R2A130]
MRLLRNKFVSVWLFGLLAALAVWSMAFWPSKPLTTLDTLAFDSYQRLKPRAWSGSDVVVLDIDEASIRRVGQWPWPRTVIADVVLRLQELGVAAVVFDVIFSEADRTSPLRAVEGLTQAGAQVSLPAKTDILDNDRVLADAFSNVAVVTGMRLSSSSDQAAPAPKAGHAVSGTVPERLMGKGLNAVRNLPILDAAATGIGDVNYDPEEQLDAVVRRVRLVIGNDGKWYPSLAMETLRVVQGAGAFILKASDASGETAGGETDLVAVKVGALEVPTDADGAITIWHSSPDVKPTITMRQLLYPDENDLSDDALEKAVANHIVLIGTSAAGLLDLRATPLAPLVPGVTIHADILDQIISGQLIAQPDYGPGVERLVAIFLALILLCAMPFLPPLGDGLAALVMGTGTVLSFWYAFDVHGLLFSPVLPLLTLAAAYIGGVAADLLVTERQGRFVRTAFSHYLAPSLVEQLAQNPDSLKLGGEEKELTILFCDIRGFTTLSEGLDPTALTELLNDFLTPMTDALLKRGATIDKYMGDAIMAFWNAPLDTPDHRTKACASLLTMRSELAIMNQASARPIEIGIGLNTGACCVGNLGSSQRFNYSAIGDAVNVASRVEGQTKLYGLDNLVAEETLENVTGFATLEIDTLGVIGRDQPLTVHTVLGDAALSKSPAFNTLSQSHTRMINAWRSGDMEEALIAMSQASSAAADARGTTAEEATDFPSLDKLYALYAERIDKMIQIGIPADWDGVYRATSK